jgi:hypothetical protein
MLRIVSIVSTPAAVGAVLVGVSTAAEKAEPFPQVIQLPTGFRPASTTQRRRR